MTSVRQRTLAIPGRDLAGWQARVCLASVEDLGGLKDGRDVVG